MASLSVSQPTFPTPLLVPEKRPRLAKVVVPDVRKAEIERLWVRWGGCIDEVRGAFRLTLKEFACELGDRDERQVQRWVEGKERPQIETVLAVERFQGPMLIALARLAQGVEVDTVVHIRRTV